VIELNRVASRTAGVSTLAIVIDGADKLALERFADALLEPLRALGPEWGGRAENGVHAEREFMNQRKALYLPLDKLRELHRRIEDRYAYEIYGSATDEEPEPITRATIEREIGSSKGEDSLPAYVDGYYLNRAGTRLI